MEEYINSTPGTDWDWWGPPSQMMRMHMSGIATELHGAHTDILSGSTRTIDVEVRVRADEALI